MFAEQGIIFGMFSIFRSFRTVKEKEDIQSLIIRDESIFTMLGTRIAKKYSALAWEYPPIDAGDRTRYDRFINFPRQHEYLKPALSNSKALKYNLQKCRRCLWEIRECGFHNRWRRGRSAGGR